MRYLRLAAAEVVGLFVSDWIETLVIVVILVVAWFVLGRTRSPGLGFALAAALGLQLVAMTRREARRRRGSE